MTADSTSNCDGSPKEEADAVPLPFSSPGRGFLVVSVDYRHIHVITCAV